MLLIDSIPTNNQHDAATDERNAGTYISGIKVLSTPSVLFPAQLVDHFALSDTIFKYVPGIPWYFIQQQRTHPGSSRTTLLTNVRRTLSTNRGHRYLALSSAGITLLALQKNIVRRIQPSHCSLIFNEVGRVTPLCFQLPAPGLPLPNSLQPPRPQQGRRQSTESLPAGGPDLLPDYQ